MRSPKELAEKLDKLRIALMYDHEINKYNVSSLLNEASKTLKNISNPAKAK